MMLPKSSKSCVMQCGWHQWCHRIYGRYAINPSSLSHGSCKSSASVQGRGFCKKSTLCKLCQLVSVLVFLNFTKACRVLHTLCLNALISSVCYFHSPGTKTTLQFQLHSSIVTPSWKDSLPPVSSQPTPFLPWSPCSVFPSWWVLPWVLCKTAFLRTNILPYFLFLHHS